MAKDNQGFYGEEDKPEYILYLVFILFAVLFGHELGYWIATL